jgi:uncharacterized protein YecE (DUF72 family)
MPSLYIGTSGYSYQDWRGAFYPKGVAQKDWLAYYAQHYPAVEVNATFYRPFAASVLEKWRDSTPATFRFVLKAPKTITHEKILVDADAELTAFAASARVMGEKCAAVLWQFPASFRGEERQARLAAFLPTLPKDLRHVFEFRHASWFNDAVYALLNAHAAGFVLNDSPQFPKPETIITTGYMLYLRLHGPGKLYDSLYTPNQLAAWADQIRPHVGVRDVFVFFNNTMRGQGLQNANELREMLAE